MTQMIWLGLIVAGVLALVLGGILLVGRIAGYFQSRFNLSIWPGMVLLTLAFVCAGIVCSAVVGEQELPTAVMVGLLAAAIVLLILAGSLNIRKAGPGWGLVALLLQGVLAACFILVVVALVFKRLVQKGLFGKRN